MAEEGLEASAMSVSAPTVSASAGPGGQGQQVLKAKMEEEAARSEELYVGMMGRLHGVLSEELLPIQDTLVTTEKGMATLAEKLQRMEGVLDSLQERVGGRITTTTTKTKKKSSGEEEEEKGMEVVLLRMEQLSNELSFVATTSKLQEDNSNLRQDLEQFRMREKHLLSRIEVMEKALAMSRTASMRTETDSYSSACGSKSESSRRSSVDAQELPPIEQPAKEEKKAKAKAKADITQAQSAISVMARKHGGDNVLPRPGPGQNDAQAEGKASGSNTDTAGNTGRKKAPPVKKSDSFQTHQIQVVRSDNAILRQDLQVFRERESQLVRRNRELEDKLLLKRMAKAKASSTTSKKKVPPRKKAEQEISIDFTAPGKALVQEKTPEKKQEMVGEKAQTELKKKEVPMQKEDSKADPAPSAATPKARSRSSSGKSSANEGEEEAKKEANFDADDWKVTVTSSHQLDITSDTPNKTVVVTPRSKEEEEEAPKEATPPSPPPKVKVAQRKERKPVTAIRRVPLPAASDARSDPIPKPPQFPCARPPRDHRPTGCGVRPHQEHTTVADLLNQKDPDKSGDHCNSPFDNHHLSVPNGVIQMLVTEEGPKRDVGLGQSAAPPPPLCQVREPPDGANSSSSAPPAEWGGDGGGGVARNVNLNTDEQHHIDGGGEEDYYNDDDVMMKFVMEDLCRERSTFTPTVSSGGGECIKEGLQREERVQSLSSDSLLRKSGQTSSEELFSGRCRSTERLPVAMTAFDQEKDQVVSSQKGKNAAPHEIGRPNAAKVVRRGRRNAPLRPLDVECFLVSRGWQLDQTHLLQYLDMMTHARVARVHLVSTLGRLVENVGGGPCRDAVVIHLGSQELMDAANSVATKSGGGSGLADSVAATMATVISRQLIKIASHNPSSHLVLSLPLPCAKGKVSDSRFLPAYECLRTAFAATLRANCSTADNIHCVTNRDLCEEEFFSDADLGPCGGLSSCGLRRLVGNWESLLQRIVCSDSATVKRGGGRLVYYRHDSISSSEASTIDTTIDGFLTSSACSSP